MTGGHFKKKTTDSALLHIGNAIGKLELMIQAAEATKVELLSLSRCVTNTTERVQTASREHKAHRGDWKGSDVSTNTDLNKMLDDLKGIQKQLKILSDAKARKK